MNPDTINRFKEVVKSNTLDKVFIELESYEFWNKDQLNTLTILKSEYLELRKKKNRGTIPYDHYQAQVNSLIERILSLLDNEDDNSTIGFDGSDFLGIVLAVLAVVATILFFTLYLPECERMFDDFSRLSKERRQREAEIEKNLEESKRRLDSMHNATIAWIDSMEALQDQRDYPEFDPLILEKRNFIGYDNRGFKAEYIVYLIRGFNWKLGEIASVEENGIPFDICGYLGISGINERINSDSLRAIICFGNTSYEEELSIPKEFRLQAEEDRAEERARKLAECVNRNLKKLTPVFISNIGKHETPTSNSAWQRQILIIGLRRKDKNVVELEALYNGLLLEFDRGNLEINILD